LRPCHAAGQCQRNDHCRAHFAGRVVPRRIRTMSRTILRGRVLSFVSEPQAIDDAASYRYLEDGAITIEDGKIIAGAGSAPEASAEIIDHRPHLLLPGFIDTHLHYLQSQIIASYAGSLLEWLNTYTFIAEQKFSQQGHAAAIATAFY